MRQYSLSEAAKLIDKIESYQRKFKPSLGSNFVYAADELYILAKRPFPKPQEYDDFPQIENGIGMAAKFIQDWQVANKDIPNQAIADIAVITGENGGQILKSIIEEINRVSGSSIDLIVVKNSFFGEKVTTTGLLTASCIINTIPKGKYRRILIPANMLKFDQDIFLDDLTVEDLSKAAANKNPSL